MNYKDDFYTYINSEWLNNNKIPDDLSKWSVFNELEEINNNKLKKILESENINENLKIIYNQYNDINLKFHPNNLNIINNIINIINKINNYNELFDIMFKLSLLLDISLPININISPNLKNSKLLIPYIVTNGLGLPDKDYYFLKKKKKIRNKYKKFINNYLNLFNIKLDAKYIYYIELLLAEKTYNNIDKSNPELQHNIYNYYDLIKLYPNIKYIKYIFVHTNIQPGIINVTNLKYIELLNTLIPNIKLEYWKNYFIFKVLLKFNNCINKNVDDCYFNFYYKTLKGVIAQKPLWKKSIDNINNLLGEILGKEFIKLHFNDNIKKKIYEIIILIKNELLNSIKNNDWMEDNTKIKAIDKLNNISIKIGYPDKYIKNYSNLILNNNDCYLKNIINIFYFDFQYNINQLYKESDKYEWYMRPYQINAYYSPTINEIVFPAGILQEPFFSLEQNMAKNFGGIGIIIGHEIIHGFDNNGCKFDKNGNLFNWWTKNDLIKYQNKLDLLKNQYNEYIIDGTQLNGELTLGENVSDLGGVNLSMKAMIKYYSNKKINLTNKLKLFFINFANVWKYKIKKEDKHNRLLTDPHSPPEIRVNGTLKNINNFHKVFDIQPNNKLYLEPNKRITIW